MARRLIKFPLKMKNGAEARSLEELRDNADVESIMKYYFSGQLSLWCKAYGYEEISADISETKEAFVKSVMDSMGVNASVEEMQEYIQNSFGVSDTSGITADIENEEEIIDDAEIKNKLKEYTYVNLDDYEISVIPVENENGKIEKYRISVVCEKNEQYYRFFLPYDVNDNYKKERFEDDLYKKIVHSIESVNSNDGYNKLKNSRFSSLNVGDTLTFGVFEGTEIEWQVLDKFKDCIFIWSKKILCSKPFHNSSGNVIWEKCDLRKWLNNDFYNNSFNEGEKGFIDDTRQDKITLLSLEEIERYFSMPELESYFKNDTYYRDCGEYKDNILLKSTAEDGDTYYIDFLRLDYGYYDFTYSTSINGIVPALYIKF